MAFADYIHMGFGVIMNGHASSPPKILGSIATENFYLLPLHSSLFTGNAPENFEVRGNSEEVRSESYIGSDLSPYAPPKSKRGTKHPSCSFLNGWREAKARRRSR